MMFFYRSIATEGGGFSNELAAYSSFEDAPADAIQVDERTFSHLQKGLSLEQSKQKVIVEDVQNFMDAAAQSYNYTNLHTAVTYADEPSVLKFQDEGKGFREWRSKVWESCYQLLAQWEAGQIGELTSQQVIDQLPTLNIVYTP